VEKYRAFLMLSVITNIYNKKTKGPSLMEMFTATGKLKNVFSISPRYGSLQQRRISMHPCLRVCGKKFNIV
jgi:hypothetical protein